MFSIPRDVFVSYKRTDRAWAEWIAGELVEACGYGRRTREVTWLESRLAEL